MMKKETALWIYRKMNEIRDFEETAWTLFTQNKLRGSVHLYTGEEAVAAGVCSQLSDDDYITSTHRGHGHCIANSRTNACLLHCIDRLAQEGPEAFLSMDESVRLEYAGGRKMVVVPADVVFTGELLLDLGGCRVRLFEAASPHTDDATLVHVPGEGVLFLGDAAAGVFPTWEKDPVLAGKLADIVEATGAAICLESHWAPQTLSELLSGLVGLGPTPQ